MNFGEKAIRFYRSLRPPAIPLTDAIEILDPLREKNVLNFLEAFFDKFYMDGRKRIFLIGINPGRFGGGITGIPFTDPVNLQEVLGIPNVLDKKHELSSRFIYDVINKMGGPENFFGYVYLTAVSPFGFTRHKKNLNYYDNIHLQQSWEPFIIDWLRTQIEFGANREIGFSLGMGKNYQYLKSLNIKHGFFRRIEALPHPRWVMQYRFKKRDDFSYIYFERLNSLINS
ncbi:MAG: DUF4918 family protein [Cyclobacteriaceae bacterium]|nr:DUF4918 family protein [Cyclobacteriaceae bacterium]